jgi:starch synthase (maltosyl-transferring)
MSRYDTDALQTLAPLSQAAVPRRFYYMHPLLAGRLELWPEQLHRIAGLGFDTVLLAPVYAPTEGGSLFVTADTNRLHKALGFAGDAESGLAHIADMIRAEGMTPLLDVSLDRIAVGGKLSSEAAWLYPSRLNAAALDPRSYDDGADSLPLAHVDPAIITDWWAPRLIALVEHCGFAGFRFTDLAALGANLVRTIVTTVRQSAPETLFLGWTPGVPQASLAEFSACGLSYVFSSLPWWDYAADWLWAETASLRRVAPVIASIEPPFGPRLGAIQPLAAREAAYRRAIGFAASVFDGWMLPMGAEFGALSHMDPRREDAGALAKMAGSALFDLSSVIIAVNRQRAVLGAPRVLSSPAAPITAILRSAEDARFAHHASFVLINNDLHHPQDVPVPPLLAAAGGRFLPFRPDEELRLLPGGVAVFEAEATLPILLSGAPLADAASHNARNPRLAIEAVTPSVDDGRFPVRRIAGEMVNVEADIICDGHDVLGVSLLWRERGVAAWQEQAMRPIGNDRFAAAFPLARIGMHEFTVEAWRNAFGTFRDELAKKHAAGVATDLEREEGRLLIAHAQHSAPAAFHAALQQMDQRFRESDSAGRTALLLSDELAALMARVDPRPFATRIDPPFTVDAERLVARFAAWYEVFPRSLSDDPERHGTFDDVIKHLPRIRDMGFDVLYFPPIHPIGRVNRKGRNNSLTPAPDDPGSPYAIGSDEGGHDALHPQLGTFDDFRRLIAAAAEAGLEIAIDFAIQCAPDHPWLREHPDWFAWRPDGSMKYAENPPKKYQDIVNVDFYGPGAIPGLWQALCEIVLFWAKQGVRIFRVDNPHTKPLPFWQWMISEVKARYPDTMFLAEAFTKPKMMYRLAKIGFTQSYSYFTWRNEKQELIDYLTELTTTAPKEFFRPNFFVNTPDINPPYLQNSGRPGFIVRATLAATLSGLWGVYNGFELCEAEALPGREEYHDSEKYQIRAWDWRRPGNIIDHISVLNRIRRANPALQTHLGVRFLPSANPTVLVYEKSLPDRSNVILVAVNLDPYNVQETPFEVSLWSWHLPDDAALAAENLLDGGRDVWHGKYQYVRLDPHANPVAIWRLSPAG